MNTVHIAEPQKKTSMFSNIRLIVLFSTIFLGIILLFALSIGVALSFLHQSNDSLNNLTREIEIRMSLSNSTNNLRIARLALAQAAESGRLGDEANYAANLKGATALIAQSQKNLQVYLDRSPSEKYDQAQEAELIRSYQSYLQQGVIATMNAIQAKEYDQALKLETYKVRDLDLVFNKPLLQVIASRSQHAQQMNATAQHNATLSSQIMGGLFMLALVLSILSFLLIKGVIITPVKLLVTRIQTIARGDLTLAPALHSRNEIGFLGSNLEIMQHALTETVSRVRLSADSIASSSASIASGNNDLSSRTEQQAAAIEQTAASMEQLTATVKQNSENAHHASQLAGEATERAKQGGTIVSDVVNTMSAISGSSKKIADITTVINGIAFQTNILALNAAVEAARAGESGRGFAVVASEVRNLAQRSAQAAKEIDQLIAASVSDVDQGAVLVGRAGQAMEAIVSSVVNVTDIMNEIASASDEQSRGIAQISQAVTELDSVTQQNAQLVQQGSAAADSLEQQAATLNDAVSAFRLTQQPAVSAAARAVAPAASPALARAPAVSRPQAHAVVKPVKAPVKTVTSSDQQDHWEQF